MFAVTVELSGLNTDGSFTMFILNWFLSPLEKNPSGFRFRIILGDFVVFILRILKMVYCMCS